MKKKKIPPYIARCLWSYDVSEIDLKRDKEMIITQVLNYGDLKGIKWLYKNYSERSIRNVIKKPRRGVWFEKVLVFWATLFGIQPKKEQLKKAIIQL